MGPSLVSMETHTRGGSLRDDSNGLRIARKLGHGQSGGRVGNSYATATRAKDAWYEVRRQASMGEFRNDAFRDLLLRQWDDGSWQMLDRGHIVSECTP